MIIDVHLPNDIAGYGPDLRRFFDAMVMKLHFNRHKGFADGRHPIEMCDRAGDELKELRDALLRGSQEDVMSESADVANFAWLTALAAFRMTKEEFERGRV
jgi:hypothetical protein